TDKPGRLWTYLMGLAYSDVQGPLAQFQHTIAEEDDTKKLIQAINKASATPLTDARLDMLFDVCWPKLASELTRISDLKPTEAPKKRSTENMTEEILE